MDGAPLRAPFCVCWLLERSPGAHRELGKPTAPDRTDLTGGSVDALFLEEDHDRLREILLLHVGPGVYTFDDLNDELAILTLSEQPLVFECPGGEQMVGEAAIEGADILASNGTIHSIGHVMLPDQPMETYRGIKVLLRVK